MKQDLNLEQVANETLELLREHKLNPKVFTVSLVISQQDFAELALKFPNQHPSIIIKAGELNGIQWAVQVGREWDPTEAQIALGIIPPPV